MDFVANKEAQIKEMLAVLGISSVEVLFEAIPPTLRKSAPQQEDGLSEWEGMQLMEALAAKNTFSSFENYLGAGAYEHHIPALVGAVTSRSEFLTTYTPYQAESSQGLLQLIFEFQSVLTSLTGLDVANASLYDGASACGEAVSMALRCQPERNKVLLAASLHPYYTAVTKNYLKHLAIEVEILPFTPDGQLDLPHLKAALDENTAAVLIPYPNFFGGIEDLKEIFAQAHAKGALGIVCANPLLYGLYASAAEIGADIAVGEGQPLGLPLQFGGPYLGTIACRQEFVRQMPGRIVGETVDVEGKRGFVLTLQAREQHIRREKATSNICTNQALAALASLSTLLWYGPEGLRKLALTNYQRAHYLYEQLRHVPGIQSIGFAPFFNEFALRFDRPLKQVQETFRKQGIEPGIDLGRFYPEFNNCLLIAVTETKSKAQLDRYVEVSRTL